MSKLKTIFFGTPDISVPFLELMHEMTDVQLVVTQADKPRGRGMAVTPCPVKQRALELGLPVLSPEKLKDSYDKIAPIPFELGVAVAYGKIFRPHFLALPKLGIINVHFSLLPRLRGAAPVQHALIQGCTQTGVSTFWICEGMDDGPLFLQKEIPVSLQDNALTLFEKLIPLGVDALKETLEQIEKGVLTRLPQQGEPTLAPMLQKEDALLSFQTLGARDMHNKVRGLYCGPKPKIPVCLNGKTELLQLSKTEPDDTSASLTGRPGTVLSIERTRGILVECKEGSIWLTEVHPAGKKAMPAADFANGHGIKPGSTVFMVK